MKKQILRKTLRFHELLLMAFPVLIAIIVRLYRITETIRFRGDQGMDLIVIWHMEHMGHLPLVGPFLSLKDFYTPPTYYYLTWFLYHLTQSVSGIVIGYFFMNIISLILLMKLAWNMGGKRLAFIVGGLFAISLIMVDHSRQFWQPFPMQLFMIISLLCLWHAFQRKNLTALWISTTSYMIALSVYPSPVLLLPYIGYQVTRWYKHNSKQSLLQSLFFSGITLAITFVVVYTPQIIFEISQGFPSLKLTGSLPSSINLHTIITGISENMFYIFSAYFATHIYFPNEAFYIVTFIAILFTAMIKWHTFSKTTRAFLAPEMLAIGLIFLLLYRQDVHDHRMWAYLPFMFLITGMSIQQALNAKGLQKTLAIIILFTYSVLNLSGLSLYINGQIIDETAEAISIARYIKQSMNSRGLTQYNTGFFQKIPLDPDNSSYSIYRFFYWLLEDHTLTIPLKSKGNEPAFNYSVPIYKDYMYIICQRFTSIPDAEANCIKPIVGTKRYTTLETKKVGRAYIFILRDQSVVAASISEFSE